MGCRAMLFSVAASVAWAQEGTTTFQHPSGVAITHPREWRLERRDEAILLSPKDRAESELILMGGEEAAGVTLVSDPRVAAFFEQSIARTFPFLRRAGEARAVDTGLGAGIVISFAGEDPGGVDVEADVYVALHERMGIYLAHVAPRALAARRRPAVRSIFASLRKGAREMDSQLIGKWQRTEYRRTDPSGPGGRSATLSRTAYTYFVFLEGGGFAFIQRSSMAGNTAELGVIASSKSSDAARGSWWTEAGRVYLSFESGETAVYAYKVERGVPVVLEMIPPGGLPSLYQLLRD